MLGPLERSQLSVEPATTMDEYGMGETTTWKRTGST